MFVWGSSCSALALTVRRVCCCKQALEELIPACADWVTVQQSVLPQLSQYDVWVNRCMRLLNVWTQVRAAQASTWFVHRLNCCMLYLQSVRSRCMLLLVAPCFPACYNTLVVISWFHSHRSTLPHSRDPMSHSPQFYFTHWLPAKISLILWHNLVHFNVGETQVKSDSQPILLTWHTVSLTAPIKSYR